MKNSRKRYILENASTTAPGEIARKLGIGEEHVARVIARARRDTTAPAAGAATSTPPRRVATAVAAALIVAAGFLAYANSFRNEFLWDDFGLIRENLYLRSWSYLPRLFTEDIISGAGITSAFYRPIQMFTYLIDYSLWKDGPAGYHLLSILSHIAVALAIFRLIAMLFKDLALSFATAALWVVHPIHTEAVTYISGRADPLATFFALLALILYVRQHTNRTLAGLLLIAASYAFGLLSKESALVTPALMLVYDASFRKRPLFSEYTAVIALTAAYFVFRSTILPASLPREIPFSLLWQRAPLFFAAPANYIRLLILPLDLHMEYGSRLFTWTDTPVLIGAIIFLVTGWGAIRMRKKSPLPLFAFLMFFVPLVPVSNVFPMNESFMSEHWIYIPSIGFFLIAGKALCLLRERRRTALAAAFIFCALVISYLWATAHQNTFWKNPVVFYERILRFVPDSPRINNNLGIAYREAGDTARAMACYRKAVELSPSFAEGYYNIGNVLASQGRADEAIAYYRKTLEANPSYVKAYNNLGVAYARTGRNRDAITAFESAIRLHPSSADGHINLGNIFCAEGAYTEAVSEYTAAMKLNPADPLIYFNLGYTHALRGDLETALQYYRKTLEVAPGFAPAHTRLAELYARTGRRDLATRHRDAAAERGVRFDGKAREALRQLSR